MTRLAFLLAGAVVFVAAPRWGFALARRPPPRRAASLRWVALALYAVGWWLPGPTFDGSDTVVQHAVGGGASCAVLALFLSWNLGVRSVPLRVVAAFSVAATLGVCVELAEYAIDRSSDGDLTHDTSVDLVANSVGAVATALVLEAGVSVRERRRRGR